MLTCVYCWEGQSRPKSKGGNPLNKPPDDEFRGRTGAILHQLDANQRAEQKKPERPEPQPSEANQGAAPVTGSPRLAGNITSLHKLAVAYHTQKRYEEAEHLYQQALAALIAADNSRNSEYAKLLNNLGRLYFEQNRYKEAAPLYARSLAFVEESLGRDHPKVARRLVNLADLYFATGKHSEADACYRRAISIEEREFGPKHSTTVGRLRAYAKMLRKMDKTAEAEAVEARAYFPRPEQDRRSITDRRTQKVPTGLKGESMDERRSPTNRRTAKTTRRLS